MDLTGPDRSFDALRVSVVGTGAATRAVEAMGARVVRDRDQLADAFVVDLTGVDAPAGDLLRLLSERTARDAAPLIVNCPFDSLDRVEALLVGGTATLLIDAQEADFIAALVGALSVPPEASVREIDPLRLRMLADEVGRIARALASLSSQAAARSDDYARDVSTQVDEGATAYHAQPHDPAPLPSAQAVQRIIRARRLRDSYFDRSLFADPAWDILLDLLAAHIEGDQVAVSSLCIAAAVPPTTALRWIRTMTEDGLLERRADPEDGRRIYVALSQSSVEALTRYFGALGRLEGVVI